jgi:hypothetical protein
MTDKLDLEANIVDRARALVVATIREAAEQYAPNEGGSYDYLAGIAAKVKAAEAVLVDSYLVLDCVIKALSIRNEALEEAARVCERMQAKAKRIAEEKGSAGEPVDIAVSAELAYEAAALAIRSLASSNNQVSL